MKRSRMLRRRPLPSHCAVPAAPVRRKSRQEPSVPLPWRCRRVTLAFAKRNFGALLDEAESGRLIFIKTRGGGRRAGAYLVRLPTQGSDPA